MGPRGCVARRLWTLLGCRALSAGAGPAAGAGSRLRLLAAGRLPAGPALGRACLTADSARGPHGGPGLEERTEGAASEGRRESGAAGTGEVEGGGPPAGRRKPGRSCGGLSNPLHAFVLESQTPDPELGGTYKVVGANLAISQ